MKTPNNLYSRLALITSLTLVTGYAFVYAYTNLTLSDADSGKPLTSTLMQTIMGNVNELNTRVNSLASGWGNLWNTGASNSINYTAGIVGIGSTTGTNAELQIKSGTKPHWGIYQDEATEELRFWNGSNRVVFGSGGNVGIGTTSPSQILQIEGSTVAGGNNYIFLRHKDQGVGQGIFIGQSTGSNDLTIDQYANNSIRFKTWGGGSVERMIIDNIGNVGIGTPSPGAKLHVVSGDIKLGLNAYGTSVAPYISGGTIERQLTIFGAVNSPALSLEYYSTGYGADIWVGTTGLAPVYFDQRQNDSIIFRTKTSATPVEAMRITGGGNVLINTTTDAGYKLDVNGSIRGTTVTPSDRNLKKNIQTLSGALGKIEELRGVTYEWKDITKETGSQVGVIAQEVEQVFPELVNTDKQGMKAVNYAGLVAPLIEAIKELKKENDSLKSLVCLDHPIAGICK